jgi:hypothetical protein
MLGLVSFRCTVSIFIDMAVIRKYTNIAAIPGVRHQSDTSCSCARHQMTRVVQNASLSGNGTGLTDYSYLVHVRTWGEQTTTIPPITLQLQVQAGTTCNWGDSPYSLIACIITAQAMPTVNR